MSNTVNVYENPALRQRANLIARRAQIADELFQIVLDAEHWNRLHPAQKPITIDLDLDEEITALCINCPKREA